MSTDIKKEELVCRTMDYHTGVKISPMDIRAWHSIVLNEIKKGASHYAISSGNSTVRGYRTEYENSIVILEFTNGYYQYTYPQPDYVKPSNPADESYNKAISDAIELIKQKALISIDDKAFFKKFGTYRHPYCSLISDLEQLIKPSQSPNQ